MYTIFERFIMFYESLILFYNWQESFYLKLDKSTFLHLISGAMTVYFEESKCDVSDGTLTTSTQVTNISVSFPDLVSSFSFMFLKTNSSLLIGFKLQLRSILIDLLSARISGRDLHFALSNVDWGSEYIFLSRTNVLIFLALLLQSLIINYETFIRS